MSNDLTLAIDTLKGAMEAHMKACQDDMLSKEEVRKTRHALTTAKISLLNLESDARIENENLYA